MSTMESEAVTAKLMYFPKNDPLWPSFPSSERNIPSQKRKRGKECLAANIYKAKILRLIIFFATLKAQTGCPFETYVVTNFLTF